MDKFPVKMYRGDGTELCFGSCWYPDHKQWWVGYFDNENGGWVSKLTVRDIDLCLAKSGLWTLLDSPETKALYFTERPLSDIGHVYDKSVVQ